jgi:phosphoglycolate phosphatase
MEKKLIIFDLDGTLLDTIQDLCDAVNYALEQFGYPKRTLREVLSFVGNGYIRLLTQALPKCICEEQFDDFVKCFKTYYAAHCCDKTKPFDGIMPLLEELKFQGHTLVVLSNKGDEQVKSLVKRYFGEIFDMALGERAGIRRKPYPDAIIEVLTQTGFNRAIYVGDSEVDVETAKNAGIECVCVDWGFRTREQLISAGAENIVSTMEELKSSLCKGNS